MGDSCRRQRSAGGDHAIGLMAHAPGPMEGRGSRRPGARPPRRGPGHPPPDWAVAELGRDRFVAGPAGAFVLRPSTGEHHRDAKRVTQIARSTRTGLGDHLAWIPVIDALVVTPERIREPVGRDRDPGPDGHLPPAGGHAAPRRGHPAPHHQPHGRASPHPRVGPVLTHPPDPRPDRVVGQLTLDWPRCAQQVRRRRSSESSAAAPLRLRSLTPAHRAGRGPSAFPVGVSAPA